jgi:hypothetical protein
MPASDPQSDALAWAVAIGGDDLLEGVCPGLRRRLLISDLKSEILFWRLVRWIEGCDTLPGEALCRVMLAKLESRGTR